MVKEGRKDGRNARIMPLAPEFSVLSFILRYGDGIK